LPARVYLLALCLLLAACGTPRYRVEVQLDRSDQPDRVALLDSTASRKIQAIHTLYKNAADSVAQVFADSLADLDTMIEGQMAPITKAERRLKTTVDRYASAFREGYGYQSFGGNAIFDASDRKVSTKDLLEDISDRFYRGKTFSLETGRLIRGWIRNKLIPAERNVRQARQTVARLKNARDALKVEREALAGRVSGAKLRLVDGYNRRVLDRLEGAVVLESIPDAQGTCSFGFLLPGKYHIYAPSVTPAVLPVVVMGHSRFIITQEAPSPLLKG